MDVLRDGTSFKNVAKNAEYLIRELKDFCTTQFKGEMKNEVIENILHLEEAFKSDCDEMFKKKELNLNGDESEEGLIDLQFQVDMLSQAVALLQGNMSKTASQDDHGPNHVRINEQILNFQSDQRKDDCLISNTTIGHTQNMIIDTSANEMLANVLHENVYTVSEDKEFFEESFCHSDEEMVSGCNVDERVCNKDARSEDSNVSSADKQTTIQDISNIDMKQMEISDHQASNHLDPSNFSEPFFTQDESAFEKCVAMLQSVEYNTEVDVHQPNTKIDLNSQNDECNWKMNKITSSDEFCAEDCRLNECKVQEVPQNKNETCSTKHSMPLVDFPEISQKLSSTISIVTPLPIICDKKTFQDQIESNKLKNDSNKQMNSSPHHSSSSSKTLCTIDKDDHDEVIKTVENNDSSLLSSAHLDKSVTSSANIDNGSILSTHQREHDWVLTPSARLSMNQTIMSKVANFVVAFNCKLNNQFNFLSTHLVVHKGEKVRQTDFYEALASHRPVVSFDWISESLKANKMLDCSPYLLNKTSSLYGDEEEFFDFQDLLILEDYEICCIGAFSGFSNDDVRRLVEMCGGKYIEDPAFFKHPRKGQNILVVATDDFTPDCEHQLRRARKNSCRFSSVSKEWLLESIYEGKPLNIKEYPCLIPPPES